MLDMKKAFDYVNREKLMQAAKEMGYPMHAFAMSTISYQWNRSICIEQRLSKPIRPRRGIAAGSAFATFELAVLLSAPMDHLVFFFQMSFSLCMWTI